MQPKPFPAPSGRTLTTAFLALSAALAIPILAVRNLYDDEIFSLYLVASHVRDILNINAQGDVHPPGMYLLAHLAWLILPSFRWMNLIPGAVFYAGLAVFLSQIVPLFADARSRLCLLLLATLHPQLLLWGVTFRWYSWWTGIALITVTIALQPRAVHPSFGVARAFVVGLLLACLFYLSYITLLFVLALAGAICLRYKDELWKPFLRNALLSAGLFLILIYPQIHTLIAVHIPDASAQRSSVLFSFLRLIQSVAISEAYLPWHPIAIAAAVTFFCLCAIAAARLRTVLRLLQLSNLPKAESEGKSKIPAFAPILLFGVLFFLLVDMTGLGGKPRNALLLVPVLASAPALALQRLRPRIQIAILLFLALWSGVGISHLLGRYGLTKSDLDERPEQVASFIQRTAVQSPPGPVCAVVVTYDGTLAFALAQANLPNLLVVSPFQDPNLGGTRTLPAQDCDQPHLYVVESYLPGSEQRRAAFYSELEIAEQFIDGPRQVDRFSRDADASMKRRLARIPVLGAGLDSATQLPDYRYVVISGIIERANLDLMRHRMSRFVSGQNLVDESPNPLPLPSPSAPSQ